MRSSLVLSMLQQMLCDDKDEEVRESVVRSLGLLTGFIDDEDKYTQVQSRARDGNLAPVSLNKVSNHGYMLKFKISI